jgi:hypothetical protein
MPLFPKQARKAGLVEFLQSKNSKLTIRQGWRRTDAGEPQAVHSGVFAYSKNSTHPKAAVT